MSERFAFATRALRHRNYRLFFFGQGVSLIGTWITRVTTGWLVYRLTDSELMLGVAGFAGQIPTFLLSPLSGVFVDRWNRYRLLLLVQVLLMVTSLGLAAFTLSGQINMWIIIALCAAQGLCNAFDIPARQALVVEMIEDRGDLPSAIALNSAIFHGSRLIGPTIAGLLIASVGEGQCYLIDGISFIAVIAAMLMMRLPAAAEVKRDTHILADLHEGFRFTFGFRPIRAILALTAITSLLGMPYVVLLPVFATEVLHGKAMMLGVLSAAGGAGALVGAVYLASRKSVLGMGRVIAICSALFGAAVIAFGYSRSVWLSVPFLVLAGGALMVQAAGSNTIIQTILEDDKRGRVMSFFAMAFMGTMPFGSLIGGEVARRIGVEHTVAIGGACCIVAAVFFARALPAIRKLVRPIYQKRGIMPDDETIAELEAAR